MPTLAKVTAQMDKHMTEAERLAREEAEAEVLPDRGGLVKLEPPALMKADARAKAYWEKTLERMEGCAILDDLDSDVLGVYCKMLSRYDALMKDLRKTRTARNKASQAGEEDETERLQGRIDSQNGKANKLESLILQYADQLGLTPSGRVRLAQKRAEQAASQAEPDGDLFGD